jgi:hypothetical protein
MFADYTAALASNINMDTLTSFLNAELKKIAEKYLINKMAVNVSNIKL